MKANLKMLLSLAALAFVSLPVARADTTTPPTPPAAPAEKGPSGRGERGAQLEERAAKELGLSAAQEAKWQEIGERQRTAMLAIRDDITLSRRECREKSMQAMKQFREERRATLNADQQKKFDDLQQQMGEKMRERGRRGRSGHDKGDQPPGN